jgi:poly-gamma-glutamate synthesis protein (capsule biosynthesis protein)
MTGRGIDQILPHPGDPTLHERFSGDATDYVKLAEQMNGPIGRSVDSSYVWGDSLQEWERISPDVRIVNLETSVTASNNWCRGKEIHYRMNPKNVTCLTAAKIDCCSLANNHVLDWGPEGLVETLEILQVAGLRYAGAGLNCNEAAAPAVLPIPKKGRVVVFSYGSVSSGIPFTWAAKEDRAGVNLLGDLSENEVQRIQQEVAQVKTDRDVVVASIHWGPNWGYAIPEEHTSFAHRLIDSAGVDLVYGHSSHHVVGLEIYRGHLILYGCGDFLDDYEGITGYEEFRDDLGLMYFARIEPSTGTLSHLCLTPTQICRMRVQHAYPWDVLWLKDVLNRESQRFGGRFESPNERRLTLETDPSQSQIKPGGPLVAAQRIPVDRCWRSAGYSDKG